MKREESVLWKKVFEELWKDRLTSDHVASELGIPSDEITSLIGGLWGTGNDSHSKPAEKFKLRAV